MYWIQLGVAYMTSTFRGVCVCVCVCVCGGGGGGGGALDVQT